MEGQWFSPGPPVSSTNKTYHHIISEILLKVALNTIKRTNQRVESCEHDIEINFIIYEIENISSYSETCLNRTSLEPTFVFRIDRCLVYTGYFNKEFIN